MSRILPLDKDAISQIHSSKHITSLQGVVLALLENSFDAKPTKVDVTVDFSRGNCTVDDNGSGIPPGEFREDGGLGKLYHTSKRGVSVDGDLYGSTGTYLASLAAISLLRVTSQHSEFDEPASLTVHNGKVIARQSPKAPSKGPLLIPRHGTRVLVRDLFGNMPVRVKQRALSGDSDSENSKAWQELKRGIVALLLAWSKPCVVKLKDDPASNRTVTLSSQHPSTFLALTEKSLNQLGGKLYKSDLRDLLPILFQAGFAAPEPRQRWVAVSAATSSISVKGTICLDPAPTKQCQFISLGIRPYSSGSGHNELYDAVNKFFAQSSFGSVDDPQEFDETEKDRRKRDRRFKSDGYTRKQLQSGKGVDRWPMFVLQIRPTDEERSRALFERTSEAGLKDVIDVLEATVTRWLAANHFLPQQRRTRRNEVQSAPTAASSSAQGSHSHTEPAATPKRAATMESAVTSKKRKVVNLSGRPAPQDQVIRPYSAGDHLSSFTRIKSGKRAFYEELQRAQSPKTAPAASPKATASPAQPRRESAFDLPPIDAGAFSARTQSPATPTRTAFADSSAACNTIRQSAEPQSSDEFGSADETAMLNAAEAVERCPCAEHKADSQYNDRSEATGAENECTPTGDHIIDWTDPVTKQDFKVNARTGVVLPLRSASASPMVGLGDRALTRKRAAIDTSLSSYGRPLSLSRRTNQPATPAKTKEWLPGFLKEWNNPVFHQQDEERVPVASFAGPGLEAATSGKGRLTEHDLVQYFEQTGTTGTSKLSKVALQHAGVIRQVDGKFILCRMSFDDAGRTRDLLVLVDQHAASERVILEQLLGELCSPPDIPFTPAAASSSASGLSSAVKTTLLEHPLRFEVSSREYELFGMHADHFARWGIVYALTRSSTPASASQVRQPTLEHKLTVKALPPGISERCTLFPRLLIELLRSEVWSLADLARRPGSIPNAKRATTVDDAPAPSDRHAWLKRIGSCPKGILDMLNSRACRSAIMFNDVLSVVECEKLMADLGECAFPFMCAHGRVSMVPLIELGNGDVAGLGSLLAGSIHGLRRAEVNDEGFVSAFMKWHSEDRTVDKCDE